MAKQRLTFFSRMLITLAIVAAVFFGGKWLIDNTALGDLVNSNKANTERTDISDRDKSNTNTNTTRDRNTNTNDEDADVIRIGVVDWVGYAAGQYYNEAFEANAESRFYNDYGTIS